MVCGKRFIARANSTASRTPKACVEQGEKCSGNLPAWAFHARTLPGDPQAAVASTRMTVAKPVQQSIKEKLSPLCSMTSNARSFDPKRAQTARNKETSGVVPAIEIAAANDTNGHGAKGHV